MKNLKVKIVSGFRKDQEFSIDAEEAHRAYYLFLNPEKRGVFSTGLAIVGQDIRHIEPDFVGSMGWNQGYNPTPEDFAEIRYNGVDKQLNLILNKAKQVAQLNDPSKLALPMSKIMELDEPKNYRIHTQGPKAIGEIIDKDVIPSSKL